MDVFSPYPPPSFPNDKLLTNDVNDIGIISNDFRHDSPGLVLYYITACQ